MIISNGLKYGLLAGAAVAAGGATKDAPYEGFKPMTFLRSPIIGGIVGHLLEKYFNITEPKAIFLSTIGGERIVVEGYKVSKAKTPGKFEVGEWGLEKKCTGPKCKYLSS